MATKQTDTKAADKKIDQVQASVADKAKADELNASAENKAEQQAPIADIVGDDPEVFGGSEGKANDRKTPLERQTGFATLTADQQHAVDNGGEPRNKAAKTEGQQIELGDRVMLVTATPIGGQTVNPAHVIGFNPNTGLPNLRLELTDGARSGNLEYGGVPQNAAQEERGNYWKWPADFAAKDDGKTEKADDK